MRTVNKIIDKCVYILAIIAAVILALLLIAVCGATISRALFNKPFSFLIDLSSYALLFVAFLGAPWLLQKGGHISIDMVVNKFPARVRKYWKAAVMVLIVIISAFLFWYGLKITISNFTQHVIITDYLKTPKWIILQAVPIGSFFLIVEGIRQTIRICKSPVSDFEKKDEEGGEES